MKKNLLSFISLFLLATILVSCCKASPSSVPAASAPASSSSSTSKPTSSQAQSIASTAVPAALPTPSETDTSFAMLQAFVLTAQAEIPTIEAALKGFATVAITAEKSSTMVVTCQLTDTAPAINAFLIEKIMNGQENFFTELLTSLQDAGVKDPVLRIVWLNKKGEEILRKDYT
ncbi:hypothetical protein LJC61_01150 [Ruminococcaceae bacterium OttesenSCG-928-A16]|nr:hypothetical protein [Ruminococcaceae bacterium OttesenSCG-928-A16]